MKIYFAASIRGGRDDAPIYEQILDILKQYGFIYTEHVGDIALSAEGERTMSDEKIHDRDLEWIKECDALVAEVTNPALGVGYEIGKADIWNKPVLCLFRENSGKRLSGMINGNTRLTIGRYTSMDDARKIIADFFNKLKV